MFVVVNLLFSEKKLCSCNWRSVALASEDILRWLCGRSVASGGLVHFSRHSFQSGENYGQPQTPSVSMVAHCGEAKVYQIASIVEVGINSAVAWRNKGMDAGCFLHGRLSYVC